MPTQLGKLQVIGERKMSHQPPTSDGPTNKLTLHTASSYCFFSQTVVSFLPYFLTFKLKKMDFDEGKIDQRI
jgi:hypothetical protein